LQIRLDVVQEQEAQELEQQLKQELELLTAYQCKIKMQASAQHKKDVEDLKARVAWRKKALKDKVILRRPWLSTAALCRCVLYASLLFRRLMLRAVLFLHFRFFFIAKGVGFFS
jgi:hypothetical protein